MAPTLSIIAKSLSQVLGHSEEKVESWLEVLIYRACEELLLSGSVHLTGVGILKKVPIPSRPAEESGVLKLLPPSISVELFPEREESGGFLYDIALDDLGLEESLAEKFVAGCATAIQKTLEFRSQVELGQLGTLRKTERGLEFEPSEWMLELLNKPYQSLEAITISPAHKPAASPESPVQTAQTSSPATNEAPSMPAPPAAPAAPATPASVITRTTIDPAEFGLDEAAPTKEEEPKIFLEQSGLLADIDKKHKRNRDKKTAFQPPIPSSPEEVDALLQAIQTREPAPAEPEPITEAAEAAIKTAAAPPAAAALPAVREELSKGALFTLIGVAVAVMAIVVIFFLYTRSTRTFPTSSPVATAPASVSRSTESVAKDARTGLGNGAQSTGRESKPTAGQTAAKTGDKGESIAAGKLSAKSEETKPAGRVLPKTAGTALNLPPALSAPVDEAKGGWTIVVASRPTEQEAKQIAATFADKGFNVSIKPRTVNGELRYRVRVGQFAQQSEALKAIKEYAAQLPKGAFLDKIQ